jgi:hypothetical protein
MLVLYIFKVNMSTYCTVILLLLFVYYWYSYSV